MRTPVTRVTTKIGLDDDDVDDDHDVDDDDDDDVARVKSCRSLGLCHLKNSLQRLTIGSPLKRTTYLSPRCLIRSHVHIDFFLRQIHYTHRAKYRPSTPYHMLLSQYTNKLRLLRAAATRLRQKFKLFLSPPSPAPTPKPLTFSSLLAKFLP